MRNVVQAGSKRKRVVSGTENTLANGRGSRTGHRVKRRRAVQNSTDEDNLSSMDVDDRWEIPDSEDDEDGSDSSDNHLINAAEPRQLLRLRKDELVRLYAAAGLTEDAELLTKHEIVDCIMAARDDIASLPPSSPPGAGDSGSSDYSSDGGNVAGGEETDFSIRSKHILRRRVTLHDIERPTRRGLSSDRCYSLTQMDHPRFAPTLPTLKQHQTAPKRRAVSRASSSHSSPTASITNTQLPSPPATRSRSRKLSNGVVVPSPTTSSGRSKGKGKQVEFCQEVRMQPSAVDIEPDSDLTDLDVLEEQLRHTSPSPRRLRSQGSGERINSRTGKERAIEDVDLDATRRVVPMRKAKRRVGSLKEESTEDEGDELEESDAEEEQVDEEVDELIQTPLGTPTPKRVRQTPLRRRLRPRRSQLSAPPSDGDDEGSDGENADVEESVDGDEGERDDDEETVRDESEEEEPFIEPRILRNGKVVGEQDEAEDDEDAEGDEIDVEDPFIEPRVLRNGKVVGEQDEAEDDEDAEGDEIDVEVDDEVEEMDESVEEAEEESLEHEEAEDEAMEDSDSQIDDAASIDLDAEGEVDTDEPMEDDIDLTIATAKSLARLRRDDLVRLCEHREIEPTGTKPQLAEALLQWRDRHCSETASSPSSTGTIRPPSTTRPRNVRRCTRSHDHEKTPPVLLRSGRVHQDEPRTPPLTEDNREAEPELEIDLESLGLEDREIPPEKLTKLEKIGSGGFKDVFIGKFKGRRVAIAEFRGQLSAMDIKELKLLGDFDHPNIVRFLGVSIPQNTKETPVMIVSELCSNGDLFDYIRNVDPPTLYRVLCIMLDVARGLEYLHTRKPSVIHRDCKSSNILITSKGVAKITDFGLAKVKQSTRSMVRSLVGTVNWQAPELWHPHPKYNHKVDVFSCAMVFWETLQWHIPNKKFPWEVGVVIQIVNLIEKMWAQEPSARPTMTEVVQELEEIVQYYR
ncbi:hypothetical protein EIP86_004343 [Pleurotus ostreatoroseus]|nr:hypothetical protein EIP86_004343 [Pleurotus ostreatoroseus]